MVSVRGKGFIQTGRIYSLTTMQVTRQNADGDAIGWYYEAIFYDRKDPQKALGYCGHKHRSERQAEICCDREIGRFADQMAKTDS